MLEIETDSQSYAPLLLLRIKGAAAAQDGSALKDFFESLLHKQKFHVCVACDQLETLGSSALAAWISFARELHNKGGELAVCDLNPELRLLFSFFGLNDLVQSYDSVQQAVHAIMRRQSGFADQPVWSEAALPDQAIADVQVKNSIDYPGPAFSAGDHKFDPALETPATERFGAQLHHRARLERIQNEHPDHSFFTPRIQSGKTGQHAVQFLTRPLIEPCERCGMQLRYFRTGLHLCPGCGFEKELAHQTPGSQLRAGHSE
ncbi:MAG: STAS domain-containing protein [Leptospiraceae bacterium]|nr:STAS domain-containing protein [Leptospiraceae bacterium]